MDRKKDNDHIVLKVFLLSIVIVAGCSLFVLLVSGYFWRDNSDSANHKRIIESIDRFMEDKEYSYDDLEMYNYINNDNYFEDIRKRFSIDDIYPDDEIREYITDHYDLEDIEEWYK